MRHGVMIRDNTLLSPLSVSQLDEASLDMQVGFVSEKVTIFLHILKYAGWDVIKICFHF